MLGEFSGKNSPSILITTGPKADELLRTEQHQARLPFCDQLTFHVGASLKFTVPGRATLPGFAGLAAATDLRRLGSTDDARWPLPLLALSCRGDQARGAASPMLQPRLQDGEVVLVAPGVAVSCENIRDCALRVGQLIPSTLRRRRPKLGCTQLMVGGIEDAGKPA